MPMMFFYFLKIIFDISTSKRFKKYKPHSILAKKKINLKFSQKQVQPQSQTSSKRRNPFEEGLAFVLINRKHTYENHHYTNNDGLAKI
jgi:hypothetical protein